MRGLLDRVNSAAGLVPVESRFTIDTWVSDYLLPASFQGAPIQTTWGDGRLQQIQGSLPGYSAAVRQSPPAFAAQMFRAMVLSQARFQWRNLPSSNTPRRTFGTKELALLEQPWPNGDTGLLISLMEWHAGLAGNAYVYRQSPTRLRVLRPDWVGIIWGSEQDAEFAATALDGELLGYVYWNGGQGHGKPVTLLPDEVSHWAPLVNPMTPADGLGESWITAALRDIQGDMAATEHKLRFWANAATPNMVVKGIPAATKTEFDEIVDMLEERHRGLGNAYRTLYLTTGADATVVGNNFKDMDLKQVQGAGETRVAMLGRVPATLLGISEGLQGSSLNEGNFGMARRIFGDGFVHPQLRSLARALQPLIPTPGARPGRGSADVELWPDVSDIPLLREDAKDAAEIESVKAQTIRTLVDGGFTPESAIAAVGGQDITQLRHTGWYSVQIQPPQIEAQDVKLFTAKATAAEALIKAGFTPESAVAAAQALDLTKAKAGDLVPKALIADPTDVGGEPGIPVFGEPSGTAPAAGT